MVMFELACDRGALSEDRAPPAQVAGLVVAGFALLRGFAMNREVE
ncbi:hypothetical protein QP395_07000 [Corynebacterium amycolatum]|nr:MULTISPECIES: hypothetical protein [Corynebacterium]MDK7110544.1 hypothetical protein [Corynebacterium amycolatum]MDK7145554.1 hypothetical protein [Corynebacterium amycolatum]